MVLVHGADFVADKIIDNLRIAAPDRLPEAEVRELLRLVALDTVVDALPRGLDTEMLPNGAPLSETQARRLALIRALAARPRLLLLDRALDNLGLDVSTKAALLDEVLGPDAPWTAVVVTEDAEVADRCVRGVLLESGTMEVMQ